KANTSAIWGLSLAKGLTALLPDGPPYAQVVDSDGVEHTLWVVDDPEACAAIPAAVGAHPVVIADGHPRYETSLAYRREREAAGDPGAAAATLAYVVELVEDELTVRAIDRLVDGLPTDRDPVALLEPWFEPLGPPPAGVPVTTAMQEAGALCAVTPAGEVLLRPRRGAPADTRGLGAAPPATGWPPPPTSTRPGWTWPWPPWAGRRSATSTGSTTCGRRWRRAGRSSASCAARPPSPRSRRRPTAASACRRRPRSSTPSRPPGWSSATSPERGRGAPARASAPRGRRLRAAPVPPRRRSAAGGRGRACRAPAGRCAGPRPRRRRPDGRRPRSRCRPRRWPAARRARARCSRPGAAPRPRPRRSRRRGRPTRSSSPGRGRPARTPPGPRRPGCGSRRAAGRGR